MKRFFIISITLLFIFLIACSGCINNDSNDNNDQNKIKDTYFYILDISPSNTQNYIIYIPIPIDDEKNESLYGFIDNLSIKNGNANYKLEKTIFGLAINISSNDQLIIESKGEGYDFSIYPLSLQNLTDNEKLKKIGDIEFIILCNTTCDQINFNLNYGITWGSSGGYTCNIKGNLSNGYNIIIARASSGGE